MFTRTYDKIVNKDAKTLKFHTRLSSLVWNISMFNAILNFLLQIWKPNIKVSLQPCEQFLLVLMKLRLGLLNKDPAWRFDIGVRTVSNVFHSWLNIVC